MKLSFFSPPPLAVIILFFNHECDFINFWSRPQICNFSKTYFSSQLRIFQRNKLYHIYSVVHREMYTRSSEIHFHCSCIFGISLYRESACKRAKYWRRKKEQMMLVWHVIFIRFCCGVERTNFLDFIA